MAVDSHRGSFLAGFGGTDGTEMALRGWPFGRI